MSVKKIIRRHIRNRVTWGILFLILIILEIVCLIIFINDSAESLDVALVVFLNVNAVFLLFAFVFFIVSFTVRCVYYKVNGRVFCVSVGLIRNYLIYNDKVVDSSSSNGFYTPPMHFNGNGLNGEVKTGSFGGVDFKVNNRVLQKGESINLETKGSSNDVNDSTIEKIKEINDLRRSGALSEEEYQMLKKKLLK